MPFDCTPMVENPTPLGSGADSGIALHPTAPKPARVMPMPARHLKRGPESITSTIAVLVRARALIGHDQYWCRGAFARSWFNVPVRPQSFFARRFCAVGAVKLAARELLLPTHNAYLALEWQAARRVEGWNDDPKRKHAEVVALFDAAIVALRQPGL
jgi:hypothetical protein